MRYLALIASAASGHDRARLPLLPALALLLGALGTFAAAPAQAQTTIWSATLTVHVVNGDIGTPVGCFDNATEPTIDFGTPSEHTPRKPEAFCEPTGALTDDDFTFDGVTYSIGALNSADFGVARSNKVRLVLDKTIPESMRPLNPERGETTRTVPLLPLQLVLGGHKLPLADATVEEGDRGDGSTPANNELIWTGVPIPWEVGAKFAVSLEYIGAPTSPLGVQGYDGYLKVLWAGSAGVEGYDVHYTSSASVAGGAAVGTNAATGWADAGWTGKSGRADGTEILEIKGLANGTEYRVRVRARYAGGIATDWAFGSNSPEKRGAAKLTPVSTLLTGITFNDGVRDLPIEPAAANAVGFGGPEHRYQVHVPPGVTSVTVTPTWTNTNIGGANGYLRSITYGGSATTTFWVPPASDTAMTKTSGEGHTLSLSKGNGAYEFKFDLLLVTRGNYRFYLIHNNAWKSADARLKALALQP